MGDTVILWAVMDGQRIVRQCMLSPTFHHEEISPSQMFRTRLIEYGFIFR